MARREDMFNSTPERYLFDHTSPVLVGGVRCQALHPAVCNLLFSPQPKLKKSENERESEREMREEMRM